jgi:hypothetical protein
MGQVEGQVEGPLEGPFEEQVDQPGEAVVAWPWH